MATPRKNQTVKHTASLPIIAVGRSAPGNGGNNSHGEAAGLETPRSVRVSRLHDPLDNDMLPVVPSASKSPRSVGSLSAVRAKAQAQVARERALMEDAHYEEDDQFDEPVTRRPTLTITSPPAREPMPNMKAMIAADAPPSGRSPRPAPSSNYSSEYAPEYALHAPGAGGSTRLVGGVPVESIADLVGRTVGSAAVTIEPNVVRLPKMGYLDLPSPSGADGPSEKALARSRAETLLIQRGLTVPKEFRASRFLGQEESPVMDMLATKALNAPSQWTRPMFPTAGGNTRVDVQHLSLALELILDSAQNQAEEQLALAPPDQVYGMHPVVRAEISVWGMALQELEVLLSSRCADEAMLLERARARLMSILSAADDWCQQCNRVRIELERRHAEELNRLRQLEATQRRVTELENILAIELAAHEKEREEWQKKLANAAAMVESAQKMREAHDRALALETSIRERPDRVRHIGVGESIYGTDFVARIDTMDEGIQTDMERLGRGVRNRNSTDMTMAKVVQKAVAASHHTDVMHQAVIDDDEADMVAMAPRPDTPEAPEPGVGVLFNIASDVPKTWRTILEENHITWTASKPMLDREFRQFFITVIRDKCYTDLGAPKTFGGADGLGGYTAGTSLAEFVMQYFAHQYGTADLVAERLGRVAASALTLSEKDPYVKLFGRLIGALHPALPAAALRLILQGLKVAFEKGFPTAVFNPQRREATIPLTCGDAIRAIRSMAHKFKPRWIADAEHHLWRICKKRMDETNEAKGLTSPMMPMPPAGLMSPRGRNNARGRGKGHAAAAAVAAVAGAGAARQRRSEAQIVPPSLPSPKSVPKPPPLAITNEEGAAEAPSTGPDSLMSPPRASRKMFAKLAKAALTASRVEKAVQAMGGGDGTERAIKAGKQSAEAAAAVGSSVPAVISAGARGATTAYTADPATSAAAVEAGIVAAQTFLQQRPDATALMAADVAIRATALNMATWYKDRISSLKALSMLSAKRVADDVAKMRESSVLFMAQPIELCDFLELLVELWEAKTWYKL